MGEIRDSNQMFSQFFFQHLLVFKKIVSPSLVEKPSKVTGSKSLLGLEMRKTKCLKVFKLWDAHRTHGFRQLCVLNVFFGQKNLL